MSLNKKKIENKEEAFLTYRGKPLVRCGDTIYYGNMNDKFVIKISVKSSLELQDLKISEKVSVRLIDTDPLLISDKKIMKISEKDGLYNALDIGSIWLKRALETSIPV